MKLRPICLALVLSSPQFGCSSIEQHSASAKQSPPQIPLPESLKSERVIQVKDESVLQRPALISPRTGLPIPKPETEEVASDLTTNDQSISPARNPRILIKSTTLKIHHIESLCTLDETGSVQIDLHTQRPPETLEDVKVRVLAKNGEAVHAAFETALSLNGGGSVIYYRIPQNSISKVAEVVAQWDEEELRYGLERTGESSGTLMGLEQYLGVVGGAVGCHFTLEYRGYGLTGKPSPLAIAVTNDAGVDSISSVIRKLRRDLHEFQVSEDSHCPTVIHIIQRQLADDKEYVLNKRIRLTYSGHLGGCQSADRNLAEDPGLTAAIAQVIGGIRDGSEESGSQATFSDCVTRISIKANDELVRSVMTDCIPLAGYDTILWRAVASKEWHKTKEEGKPVALVQFFGAKR